MGRSCKGLQAKMRIMYDHQAFILQKYGGISRYFFELAKEFNKMDSVEIDIPLLMSNNHYMSKKEYTKHIDVLANLEFRGKHRTFNVLNKLYSIRQINRQYFDIFHPTYYDLYFLKYIGSKPFVLTVYDMIHEKFSDMFSVNDRVSKYKKLLVEKAVKVIAISESTKKDLIEIFGTDESKIEVVYLGNSMEVDNQKSFNIKLPAKYILFVGSRGGYKNFDRFLNAVSKLLKEDKDLHLICVGGGGFSTDELVKIETMKIKNQVTQYNLNDDTLAYFYSKALAFIFPSLYEGFGIPVLESFACGCPLICSDTSSLPEIAKDAAVYFDPYSEDSIYEAVKEVISNKELQDEMKKKGFEQLKKFSWKKTTMETKKVYESVMK
jgi:glycosyltransferase involved in cell wall biosynthesis